MFRVKRLRVAHRHVRTDNRSTCITLHGVMTTAQISALVSDRWARRGPTGMSAAAGRLKPNIQEEASGREPVRDPITRDNHRRVLWGPSLFRGMSERSPCGN